MSEETRIDRSGTLGVATLTRPKALNALTHGMIGELADALSEWESDSAVVAVVIKGEGERAFCAGGDVRAVYKSVVQEDGSRVPSDMSREFFFDEYRLNRQIFAFSKSYIALLDGVTMGGGVGLSVHGSHRIATERLIFAMPETTIGLFPDVGGGWFLPRLGMGLGNYLALTGARLDAAGALSAGVATHFVPSEKLEALEAALANCADRAQVDAVIDKFSEAAPGEDELAPHRDMIDRCFDKGSVEDIFAALEAEGGEFAEHCLTDLKKKSPTALKISLEQLQRGAKMASIEEVLVMEYRMAQACMHGHDFFEGVRALLVDKDHAPKWSPVELADVNDALVARHFEVPSNGDLHFN